MVDTIENDDATELEVRLRTLLPESYQVFDPEVQPVSMGSAGLKFGADGSVLWNEMWASFCDLATAGGPPHRGRLLECPRVSREEVSSPAYRQVSEEICRGIGLVTGLCAEPSPRVGWVRLYCTSAAMAGWLMRAIVMENVSASAHGLALDLPAGAAFRVEKEIKNVITAVAKTCHYWQDHMSVEKHQEIAGLLAKMDRETPLVYPDTGLTAQSQKDEELRRNLLRTMSEATGLQASDHGYRDWIGIQCGRTDAAIWMMRALCVSNVLARREESIVFLPVDVTDTGVESRSVSAVTKACHLAVAQGVFFEPGVFEMAATAGSALPGI